MTYFLKKISIFLLLITLYFSGNLLVNLVFISRSNLPLDNANTVIAGDSHSKYAVNPDLFYSAYNISQDSEPYYLTYIKLKYILNRIKFDTLVLGFSEHNLSSNNDLKLVDKTWSTTMFIRNYSLFNSLLELEGVKIDYQEFGWIFVRNMCFYPKKDHIKFIGNYINKNETHLYDHKEVLNRHF